MLSLKESAINRLKELFHEYGISGPDVDEVGVVLELLSNHLDDYVKELKRQFPFLKHNGIVREGFADGYNQALIKIFRAMQGEKK